TLTGFKNSETLATSGVTGAASCTTLADAFSPVASAFTIDCAQGTLAAGNYDFSTFVAGHLTITKAHLTVTADNQSRLYGNANPSFSYHLNGIKPSENTMQSGTTEIAKCTTYAIPTPPGSRNTCRIASTTGTIDAPD